MRILVAGDFCPRGRVSTKFEGEDYKAVFSDVRELTSEVDLSVVNLECPVLLSTAKPIEKNGPNLSCGPYGVAAIKWAGFSCVTLANNHILDYGNKGVADTLKELEGNEVDYVGGGLNLNEASSIYYKDINGYRLAIINCCEHEFSIATNKSAGSNPLNPIQQYYAIREAKKQADFVLLIVHGGHEHFQLPSPRMVETYRFFIDAGADAVINHHQHCYSGYEIYQGKPIFYGLGNFCFDSFNKPTKEWTEGYAVILDFSKESIRFDLHPYQQCADEPNVKLLGLDAFDERLQELNKIIADPVALNSVVNNYYKKCAKGYGNIFEPFYNRIFLGAKHRGWLPSLISKKRIKVAFNFIACEAHRDKLIWWLNNSK